MWYFVQFECYLQLLNCCISQKCHQASPNLLGNNNSLFFPRITMCISTFGHCGVQGGCWKLRDREKGEIIISMGEHELIPAWVVEFSRTEILMHSLRNSNWLLVIKYLVNGSRVNDHHKITVTSYSLYIIIIKSQSLPILHISLS